MKNRSVRFRENLIRDREGNSSIEYASIAAFPGVAIIVSPMFIGGSAGAVYGMAGSDHDRS